MSGWRSSLLRGDRLRLEVAATASEAAYVPEEYWVPFTAWTDGCTSVIIQP